MDDSPEHMKRLIILSLLASMMVIPALIGMAVSEEPQELIRSTQEGIESQLIQSTRLMSGSSALAIEGKDYRVGETKGEALEDAVTRSPVMQGAAAALVPFRSPTAQFSRNILITRDLGGTPIQTEPHIAVNPLDPEHLIVGVIDYNAPNVVSYVSIDAGQTWEGPFQPRYIDGDLGAGGDPVVDFDRNGNAYIASISIGFEEFTLFGAPFEQQVSSIAITRSEDGGYSWETPVASARSKVNLNMEQPFGNGLVGTLSIGFLDKPWMTVGPNALDPSKDVIYVTYTEFVTNYEIVTYLQGGLYAFQNPSVDTTIRFVRSEDGGKTWSSPVDVSPTVRQVVGGGGDGGDQFSAEERVVQGSQPEVTEDGTVYVTWLDSTDDSAFEGLAEIWVAKSDDGGRNFENAVVASNFLEPDYSSRSVFFRSWGGAFPQISAGPDGEISLVYIGRPAGKPTDDGDVYHVRSTDDGKTWTRPQKVNDDITNRYQFFPAVSIDPTGKIHVMWGDFRDDKSEQRFHIYYSYSEDGGETWLENSRVTDFPTNPNYAFPDGQFMGDYYAIESTEDDVFMVWSDGRLGELGGYNQKVAFARLSPIRSSSIFLSPPSGAGGKDVVIQGFDFQPNQDIFLEVSGAVVGSGRTDSDGKFSLKTFVPISGEGAHDIRVFDASGNVATASFYMEFGFDTIEGQLLKTVQDLQIAILGAPVGENISSIEDTIIGRLESLENTLTARIANIEEGVDSQSNMMTYQIWGVAALAIIAIVVSGYSIISSRKPST